MTESQTNQEIHISLVAPAYNEADNLRALIEQAGQCIEAVGRPGEMILVNDCSDDNSEAILGELVAEYPWLRVLKMARRSGQSSALAVGLRNTRGRYVGMMDADLQNDPSDIPAMLALITSGQCDMVNGWRKDRNDTWLRRISSRLANGIRNKITREDVHDSACGLKVFKRECIDGLVFFHGMHRFLPTLIRMQGYRIREVPVNHRPRIAGKAKYGLFNRLIKPFCDTLAIRWLQDRQLEKEYRPWP